MVEPDSRRRGRYAANGSLARSAAVCAVAFVGGFNSIILIAAILSFAGAAAGFFLTRSKYFVQQTNG